MVGGSKMNLFHEKMITVNMRIAQRMHKLTQLQIADLRHHHRQKGIACNVERFSGHHVFGLFRYDVCIRAIPGIRFCTAPICAIETRKLPHPLFKDLPTVHTIHRVQRPPHLHAEDIHRRSHARRMSCSASKQNVRNENPLTVSLRASV